MNVTERPEPAVRRPPQVTVDGDAAMKTLGVTTINQRDVECQHCWNRTVQLQVVVSRDLFLRSALAVAVVCALVCAWVAWRASAETSLAQSNHETHKEK